MTIGVVAGYVAIVGFMARHSRPAATYSSRSS